MDNVENLQIAYRAWAETRGASVDVWISLMSDSVVMRSLADGGKGMEFSATRRGETEARQYFDELRAHWEVLSFTAEEFIREGDRVVVLGSGCWRSKATGKEAQSPIAHFWRFRDGKATEFYEFYDTARAFAAATPD